MPAGSTLTRTVTRQPGARPEVPESGAGVGGAVVAGGAVGLVVLAAVWFRFHPGPTAFDRWGLSLIRPTGHRTGWTRVTQLRSPAAVAAGSVLAAAVVVARDRWRALACLVGPALSVVLTEYVLKPVAARHYFDTLSFPSGTTAVVAAMATAWVLAVPRRVRPPVAVVGVLVVALESVAVITLQWHFPSEALAGAVLGAGTVVLLDRLLHLVAGAARRGRTPVTGPVDAVRA